MSWLLVDLAVIAPLAGLLWMVRRVEAPQHIKRLVWPCLGASILYALGDVGMHVFQQRPPAFWAALLLTYAGYLTIAPSWFLLAVYTAERGGSARARALSTTLWRYVPAAVSGLAFAALASNPWHGAFLRLTPGAFAPDPGPLWWASELAAGLTLIGASSLCAATAKRAVGETRKYMALIAATLAFMVVSAVLLPVFSKNGGFDPTLLGVGVGAWVLLLAMVSRRFFLLRAVPFAAARAQDPDAVLLIDALGFLVDANEPARALFGACLAPPSDVLQRVAASLEALERERLGGETLANALAVGTGANGIACRTAGAAPRVVRLATTLLRDPVGQRAALLLRAHDETALHEARRDADERAALLEAMWAATGDAVWVVDREDRVRFANDAMARIVGLAPEEMRGREVVDLVTSAPDGPSVREPALRVRAAFARNPLARIQGDIEAGGRIYERLALPLLRDGEPFGRISRLRDVTEQRRNAEALRESAKLESLSVLAGGVAHDFNNLLTAILGSAELASREVANAPRAQSLLQDLRAAAERGGDLAKQLLDYAGRSPRAVKLLDLSALVEEISGLLAVSVPRSISLQRELAPGLGAVRGDPSQLRQVVMNLVLNAADAIADKPGRIETSTSRAQPPSGADDGSAWIALRVADDGAGMSAETRARIFDPFFTTKPTGRGLGLASVRGIVAQHGGTITVESEPGHGSTFTVLLPALNQLALGDENPPLEADGGTLGGAMLIVDDDVATLRVSRMIAESLGFEVTPAELPSAGLAAARARRFRVALIDATMPECSGAELLAKLRAEHPALPAIVYSGFTRESVPLPTSPPTAFLGKPFRRAELEAALRRVLAAR